MLHPPLPYRKWLLLALLIQVVTAYFSVGFHQLDEHFQILEFANYKLGLSPAGDLAWEYTTQCRPALQPFIAYCFGKALLFLHLYDPFVLAFLLRLTIGLLSFWTTYLFVQAAIDKFKTDKGRKFFVIASFFLWFVPYLSVRFSAEIFSGVLLLFALSILLKKDATKNSHFFLVGLLLGLSLFARLQIVFALAGIAIWCVFIQRLKWKQIGIIILSFIIAIGIGVLIDYWFYGKLVFTPYNYFDINIIQNVAAKFGTEPWWWYFTTFIINYAPPINIVLLLLFFFGIKAKPLQLVTLCCLFFIVGHILVGHKELRFLFPVSALFIYICAYGFDHLAQKYPNAFKTKIYAATLGLFIAANFILLIYKAVTPTRSSVNSLAYIYHHTNETQTVVCYNYDPYKLFIELNANFYKPTNVATYSIMQPSDIDSIFSISKDKKIFFLCDEPARIKELTKYHPKKVYRPFPDVSFRYNTLIFKTEPMNVYELHSEM